jgi:hypothetical protein
MKLIVITSIFFIGSIIPSSSASAQKRLYFGADLEPLALSFYSSGYGWSAGIRAVVPVGSVEADVTMKLPNFIGLSTPIKEGSDEGHRKPPEAFFLLSFGVRF